MAYYRGNGTESGIAAVVVAIKDFLTNTVGWRVEGTGSLNGATWWGVGSSGEAGTKTLHVGLYPRRESATVGSLQMWPSRCYCAVNGFTDQPDGPALGTCGIAYCATRCGYWCVPSVPVQADASITWWCYADLDSFVVILKSGVFYHAGYVGLLNSYHPEECDIHPFFALGGSCYNMTECYVCAKFWPFSQSGANAQPTSWARAIERSWCCCGTPLAWHCTDICCWYGMNFVTRFTSTNCNTMIMGIHFNKPYSPWGLGGGRTLTPIMVGLQLQETAGLRGTLKNVFHVPSSGLAAEGVITVAGNSYRVFPPVTADGSGGATDANRWIAVRDY